MTQKINHVTSPVKTGDLEGGYHLARNGLFLKKSTVLFDACVPIAGIGSYYDLVPEISFKFGMISQQLLSDVILLFKQVYAKYSSECSVYLFYNKDTQGYEYEVPFQSVDSSSVICSVRPSSSTKTRVLVGTIHSHASMDAFHSSTDIRDEKFFDGLHVVIGNLYQPKMYTMCASFVVNGYRQRVDMLKICQGIAMCQDFDTANISKHSADPSIWADMWPFGDYVASPQCKKDFYFLQHHDVLRKKSKANIAGLLERVSKKSKQKNKYGK